MSATDDAIVTFIFPSVLCQPYDKSGDHLYAMKPKKIRVPKSMLMKVSPVFEAMFSVNWDSDTVVMEDDVEFNQFEKFQLFLEVLLDLTLLSR